MVICFLEANAALIHVLGQIKLKISYFTNGISMTKNSDDKLILLLKKIKYNQALEN